MQFDSQLLVVLDPGGMPCASKIGVRNPNSLMRIDSYHPVQEENRRLQREIAAMHGNRMEDSSVVSSATMSTTTTTKGKYDDKLKEAMKALKRVTISQEQCINQMQQKAQERRKEIKMKDAKIQALQRENASLKTVQNQLRESSGSDEGSLQSKLADMQVKFGEMENQSAEMGQKLRETEEECSRLQREVVRGRMQRSASSRSIKSVETGSSMQSEMESAAKLKKELAQKIEKIVLLEMDLEMVKDELHELKQKQMMNDAFPGTDFKSGDEDFFDDDEDDDDPFWS